jgi:hypothetical protein
MSTLRSMLGAAALTALALTAGGCTEKTPDVTHDTKADGGNPGGPDGTQEDGGGSPVPANSNEDIWRGLSPACAGCHVAGSKPFFASLTAFENGLVYDERYVKPGDPANSLLVQLLEGHAPGIYPQMPPGLPYGELVANGTVTLTLEQVKAWIRNLPPASERPDGGNPGGPDGDGGTQADGGSCPPANRNDEIRLGLAPACEGCHLVGNKPFFASLSAFENGLVYDPRYVKPGDPANSMLIQLLKGHAPGSYPQMPPGQPYDELVANGRVKLTLAEVEAWIRELSLPGEQQETPDPEEFNVRRLSAEEMVVSLMQQLGLTLEDFVSTTDPNWRNKAYVVNGGKLFVWPGDWAPGISTEYVSDSRSVERFDALGGGNSLLYRKKDVGFGPSAAQTLVQMSQAWCARAVDKKGNTAVLRHVTLADTSTSNPDAVQKNLRSLYLRMLGQPPSDAEAKQLYEQVYLPLQAQNTRIAWIGTCAALIRHPLWITY